MPTLQFKGKNIIWNHHLSVPYHTLEESPKLHFQTDKSNGNLIIEGDNLLALKALLPMYAGKVKVVCIDPPYNTGNEGWLYNDNANSPLIKDWLGKEVGKDDLTRHDKWLCMMTPRLRLLRELLADDGVIFVNIDDNEVHHLRSLMDEVFGEENFITHIIWQKKTSPQNDAKYFSDNHDFIIVYAKKKNLTDGDFGFSIKLLERTEKHNANYTNPDNDSRGPWMRGDFSVKTYSEDYDYEIVLPSGKKVRPPRGRCWMTSKERYKELLKDNRIWLGKDGDSIPAIKRFLSEVKQGITPLTIWFAKEVGSNSEARRILKEIFPEVDLPFENPKPVSLINKILKLSTNKNSLILDSFSGSGTTGHAVMDLNKEDGGNRKFILVQMTEATEKESDKNICKDITRERIKRAIEKYDYNSGFQYLRVGQPLDAETLLKGKLPEYKTFAKYVYYLCTGENLKDEKKISEKKFFIGTFGNQAIYLIYKQDYEALTRMALNLEFAEKIIAHQPDKKRIVYAPACFLDEEYMEANQIEFVSIPYNLFQRNSR